MNCDCCLDQESEYELAIHGPIKSNSHKNLLASQSMNNLHKNYGRYEENKISLRKKNNAKSMTFSNQYKIGSQTPPNNYAVRAIPKNRIEISYTNNIPTNYIVPNHSIHQQLNRNRPQFPISNVQQIFLPQKIATPIVSQIAPAVTNYRPVPIVIHQQQKIRRPEIKISYQQNQNTTKKPISNQTAHTSLPTNNINNVAYQVSPIKVQFDDIPTSTRINSGQNAEQTQRIQRKISLRKSSIEFLNKESYINDEFKGKMSIELKKVNSLGKQMGENGQKNNSSIQLVRSARLKEQHIHEIICKRTESIKGENDNSDSMDRLSEVVRQNNDYPQNRQNKLMTNSETKFGKLFQKNVGENKRSIIWENSRKESLSQF